VLALRADDIVSVDHLVKVVWGENAPHTAAATLQNHVSYLRGVLGARSAIVARPPGYTLTIAPDATDIEVAERLIRQGKQATDPVERATTLRAAVSLWRGRALADVAGHPWLDRHAERLADLHLVATHALVEARLNLGEHEQLVLELQRLSDEHPYDEQLCGQLMLALYRAGRQADALASYRELRRRLDTDLGIHPGQALRDLEARILKQDGSLAPVPAIASTTIATGPRIRALEAVISFARSRAKLALPPRPTKACDTGRTHGGPHLGVSYGWRRQDAQHASPHGRGTVPDGQLYVRPGRAGGSVMGPAKRYGCS
jgi:DNA-binding SARP family transcriptional activator